MKKFLLAAMLMGIIIPAVCQKKSGNNLSADQSAAIKIKNQPRFYVSIHGGYAMALGSTFKFYPDNISSVSIKKLDNSPLLKEIDYEANSKGFGDGYRVGGGLSYIVNDFINLGIDVDYLESTISKIKDSSYYSSHTAFGNTKEWDYKEQYKISYETSLLLFSPNITFKAIARPTFFIYNKIGAIIVLHPTGTQRDAVGETYIFGWQGSYRDSLATTQKKYEWGIRNPALGFMGGLGCQATVTKKIRAYIELQFSHIVFEEQNKMLTSLVKNGNEMIATLSRSQRETVFKRDYKTDNNIVTNPDEPRIETYQRIPITYAGVQMGIVYRF